MRLGCAMIRAITLWGLLGTSGIRNRLCTTRALTASNRRARFFFKEEVVGYIERECSRIEAALSEAEPDGVKWRELHIAQQALKWATEPQEFATPLHMIESRSGQAVTSTPEGTADCLTESHPDAS